MKTMSDEVTLIREWIAQGQQTDDGGIPIPPRMEEVAIARIRKRLFGEDRSEPPLGYWVGRSHTYSTGWSADFNHPDDNDGIGTTRFETNRAGVLACWAHRDAVLASVEPTPTGEPSENRLLLAAAVPDPLPELLGALRRTLTGSVAISSGSAGVLAQCRHCGFMAKRSDQDDALAAIPHKSDCPWAVLSRARPAPEPTPLPEGARWDMKTLVLSSGRRLILHDDVVGLWNDSWHPDGTDTSNSPRTVEEALGVAAVLSWAKEGA